MRNDLEQIVHYATLAPSSHNSQPWKFQLQGDRIKIIPDFSRALPIADSDNHALYISLGCALENLVIAAAHYNYHPFIYHQIGMASYIEVTLIPIKNESDDLLFEQIEVRQTTRNKFDNEPIPKTHLELLKAAALQEDVECKIITRDFKKEAIIELVKEATALQYSNKEFVAELEQWIRFNKSEATESGDGIFSAASGQPTAPAWLGKLFMKMSLSPSKEVKKNEELIRSSSALAVFAGMRNDQKAWVNIGRSFERFSLTATALNIHIAHHNMVCEELETRQQLAEQLLFENGEQPLLLVRLGYSEKMPYSYRRPLHEVVAKPEVMDIIEV